MNISSYYNALKFSLNDQGWNSTSRLVAKMARQALFGKAPFKSRAYPGAIIVGSMNFCNLQCQHCYLRAQPTAVKRMMDINTFARMTARITPLIEKAGIFNFATVEALFHPKLFEMMDMVRSINPALCCVIFTNGMLLDEARIDAIIHHRLRRITISLDGCNKSTVEAFKTGIDFDKVIRNIRLLRSRASDNIRITTIFVAHRKNIKELPDYVDFCAELGVDAIIVNGLIAYQPEAEIDCLYSWEGRPDIDAIILQAEHKADRIGICLRHLGTKLNPVGCGSSDVMYIDLDGNVTTCAMLAQPTAWALAGKKGTSRQTLWGNIFKQNPYDIWTSASFVEFRKQLYENHLPTACSLCAAGHKVIC
ncbi:MAG: radical SAM protein [Verrucomicrobia bacterium]|nr:radical SAM protein [Verrucomicrobiota bacterium]MBU1735459.1 radical SAM protein [Verrucomicrobiota bacterium]MBU1856854.1 radical SAM protein [Verrucomicrobiota bacterium]